MFIDVPNSETKRKDVTPIVVLFSVFRISADEVFKKIYDEIDSNTQLF